MSMFFRGMVLDVFMVDGTKKRVRFIAFDEEVMLTSKGEILNSSIKAVLEIKKARKRIQK